MTDTSIITLLARVKRILKKVEERQTDRKKKKSLQRMIGSLSKAMDIIAIKRDKEVREKIVSIKVREESELLEDTLKVEDTAVPLKEDPPPPKYYVQPVQVVRRQKK